MSDKILLRRGVKADLPTLNVAEPGFATDTKELFIGASGGNVQLTKQVDFAEHLGKTVSQQVTATRDLSIAGVQSISVSGKPKAILVMSNVGPGKKMSIGNWSQDNMQYCIYMDAATSNFLNTNAAICIADSTANRTFGKIQNVADGSLEILWSHSGTGATGSVQAFLEVIYHGE